MADAEQLVAGTRVFIHYPDGERAEGTVRAKATPEWTVTSRGTELITTAGIEWDDGDYTGERPEDIEGVIP